MWKYITLRDSKLRLCYSVDMQPAPPQSSSLPVDRPAVSDLSALARSLSEARTALRDVEATALASVAEILMKVTEAQMRMLTELASMGSDAILTLEQAAVEMGYVDDDGHPRTKAWSKAAAEKGFRRHVLNANNIYYIRRELHEDVARLSG